MGGLKREAAVLVEQDAPDEQCMPQALRSLQAGGDSFDAQLEHHLMALQKAEDAEQAAKVAAAEAAAAPPPPSKVCSAQCCSQLSWARRRCKMCGGCL